MSFVRQVCDGYSKTTLIGNWNEQRQYPPQPFRDNLAKAARPLEVDIATTQDGKGFQRALPRLERRTKWDTKNIIPDDGFREYKSRSQLDYPHGQLQSYLKQTQKPLDKNSDNTRSTPFHPHAEHKLAAVDYKMLTVNNVKDQENVSREQREVPMNKSEFRSTFHMHNKSTHNKLFAETTYNTTYGEAWRPRGTSSFNKTAHDMVEDLKNRNERPAGCYSQVKQETIKPITTMYCENKKQTSDLKEDTGVQRSWLPFRDRSLTHSTGKTATDFAFAKPVTNDIQTSTNMNIGVHSLHPKQVAPGYYRHVRQEDITVKMNKPFSHK